MCVAVLEVVVRMTKKEGLILRGFVSSRGFCFLRLAILGCSSNKRNVILDFSCYSLGNYYSFCLWGAEVCEQKGFQVLLSGKNLFYFYYVRNLSDPSCFLPLCLAFLLHSRSSYLLIILLHILEFYFLCRTLQDQNT